MLTEGTDNVRPLLPPVPSEPRALCYGDLRRQQMERDGLIGHPSVTPGHDPHATELVERWADRKARRARERAGLPALPVREVAGKAPLSSAERRAEAAAKRLATWSPAKRAAQRAKCAAAGAAFARGSQTPGKNSRIRGAVKGRTAMKAKSKPLMKRGISRAR